MASSPRSLSGLRGSSGPYGLREIRSLYPSISDKHLRYLEKWGVIGQSGRPRAGREYSFSDLLAIKHAANELERGTPLRTILRGLLAELHLTDLARAPAYTLSGGERRRAEITRALVLSPKFMLLDEPFAGIDPIAVTDIQKIIFHLRDRGIGVLITDHNVRETLRITDRAYIVHAGQIFRSGTPTSLAADDEVRRIYLGTEFRLD